MALAADNLIKIEICNCEMHIKTESEAIECRSLWVHTLEYMRNYDNVHICRYMSYKVNRMLKNLSIRYEYMEAKETIDRIQLIFDIQT